MSLTGRASSSGELHGSVNSAGKLHGNAEASKVMTGKMAGLKTIQGYSAYEVAVLNGFVGSEEEWLESLKGETGEQGERGEPGQRGDKGDRGDPGVSGVYIGSTEPSEQSVNVWIDPNGDGDIIIDVEAITVAEIREICS